MLSDISSLRWHYELIHVHFHFLLIDYFLQISFLHYHFSLSSFITLYFDEFSIFFVTFSFLRFSPFLHYFIFFSSFFFFHGSLRAFRCISRCFSTLIIFDFQTFSTFLLHWRYACENISISFLLHFAVWEGKHFHRLSTLFVNIYFRFFFFFFVTFRYFISRPQAIISFFFFFFFSFDDVCSFFTPLLSPSSSSMYFISDTFLHFDHFSFLSMLISIFVRTLFSLRWRHYFDYFYHEKISLIISSLMAITCASSFISLMTLRFFQDVRANIIDVLTLSMRVVTFHFHFIDIIFFITLFLRCENIDDIDYHFFHFIFFLFFFFFFTFSSFSWCKIFLHYHHFLLFDDISSDFDAVAPFHWWVSTFSFSADYRWLFSITWHFHFWYDIFIISFQ